MADEIIRSDTLSKDMLQSLFKGAYMETYLDKDGDLVVKEGFKAYVYPDADGRHVRLASLFTLNPKSKPQDRLAFVNKVNQDLHTVRAAVLDAGVVALDYYIPVDGGITPQAIVLAVKRFQAARDAALRMDEKDVLS